MQKFQSFGPLSRVHRTQFYKAIVYSEHTERKFGELCLYELNMPRFFRIWSIVKGLFPDSLDYLILCKTTYFDTYQLQACVVFGTYSNI